ncbi:molybdenum ABC transporter permease [Campylobacter concisus]|uniref:Molybdenum transport system permease protein ModB n=1 Tax=Campylobacter concisus ATCC 51562 TaxID=1242969 RepID=U2F4I0_9BACT|nr:ABC transporter permease subunit [Campylobacter concisus]ERJ25117.1 Molybdenum transport system permease protein ModB [Campylobacter concisus ATCC 51562]OSQ22877.1 molybdenum ABC transporter permease [Campylobacter concisus]
MQELSWLFDPLFLSIKVVLCQGALLIIFGLALAYYLAFSKAKFKAILEMIVTFPLIFPPIATGFLLLYLLGKNGIVGKALNLEIIFSFKALVLAAFIASLPLFVKPVASALGSLSKSLSEAAYSLGKDKFQTAIFVLFPCVAKSVAAAFILAISRGLGEVGITLILGGNIIGKTDTISLAIYNAVYDGKSDEALVLSLVLVVLSFILFGIINLLDKSKI